MKSEGDFEDILAADKPDVWESHRPAKGGEAGAMLAKIIERAAALKGARAEGTKDTKATKSKGRRPRSRRARRQLSPPPPEKRTTSKRRART